MDQAYYFQNAQWVGASERNFNTFSILRGHFHADHALSASLHVLGLGFFKCYINGICINPDTFLPLSSEYESSALPNGEVFSGKRVYVPRFDITPYLQPGDNVIAIHFGGGWYTYSRRPFGLPKAIYCITVENTKGTLHYTSGEACRISNSFVADYCFTERECQDYTLRSSCLQADFDDSRWAMATVTEQLDTNYCTTQCPADTLIRQLTPQKLGNGANGTVYDCGKNITGVPVLELDIPFGKTVSVSFSEKLLPDGTLDPMRSHKQIFSVVSDGKKRIVQPEFTWFGFRYLEIVGPAKVSCVKELHADISITSDFSCDDETLNWIYQTFLHTMLCNLHTGHPCDCPHIERRGYTGDGQLTCNAVLTTLDAKVLYEKWLQDIADGQDTLTGHIQYTAPYVRSGGGPGGWGCAIVEVPYQMYKHYGDSGILERYYGNMFRYADYLEAHSEFGLVTSDKAGEWCLGDWCAPVVLNPGKSIISNRQQFLIPPPFVNTYFAVKTLERLTEIAKVIGKTEDIPDFQKRAELHKKAIHAAYFTPFEHNYIANAQGANAFALDLGLGTERTLQNLVDYYQISGHLDTGIFATDVLIRLLFETGNGELALDLLTNDGPHSFRNWQKRGASTFCEYWNADLSRSHNHPMFGAVVSCFFEYILGIKQAPGTAGYEQLVIAPQALSRFSRLSGSIRTSKGEVSVSYKKENDAEVFSITIPSATKAHFHYKETEQFLTEGTNYITL